MAVEGELNPVSPTRFWRPAVAIAAGVLLTYFVLVVSLSGVLGERRPDVALDWRPGDARANAALASQMLAQPGDTSPEQMRDHALKALQRDPTAIDAVRVLATLDMQSDREKSRRLMRYALALSRRDLATHLWYIEDYVARSSVPGALYHYDAALRTSRRAGAMLMPVLVSASSQPKVVAELDRILDRDPPWRDEYIEALVEGGESFDAWLQLPLKYLDPHDAREADLVQTLLNRLVAARQYALAARVDSSKAASRGSAAVHNGEFDEQPQFTPFDWILVNEQGFSAQIDLPEGGTDPALVMTPSVGREGPMASQLIRLASGPHRISAVAGDVQRDGQVYLTLRCIETNQPLLRLNAPRAAADGRQFAAGFTVPAGACPAQWLDLGVTAGPAQDTAEPWLDSVAVSRGG